jgi:signal transduction histidine kinase
MLRADDPRAQNEHFVLSNLPPSRAQKRLALGIVFTLGFAMYLVVGPFGGIQLGAVHSFVAIYATGMFVTDIVTAVLLYTQFSILRSRAILVIASGYLFTASLIVPYVLAFPGVLAPDGLVGGLQTTAHLYLIWHCGFPLFVIGYAVAKDPGPSRRFAQASVAASILRSVVVTTVAAAAVAATVIKTDAALPRIMLDQSRFVPEWPWVVGAPIVLLCSCALLVLWWRRRSILDLFLMVVMCAYIVEIPPHYYPSPARFSTGWYAVRITSLVSSSIVLVVLLYEITALYGGLLTAVLHQRREREARLLTGDAVAASIAHEVRQPLAAMVTTADAGLRFLDRAAPNLDRAKEAFRRIVADGHRAGDVIGSIRANFKSDVRERVTFDLNELIDEAIALGQGELEKHRITVQSGTSQRQLPLHASRTQLQQVLLNLIMNAIDAMSKGEPRLLSITSETQGTDGVKVSVADTGAGIQAEDADRIFNPLFTSKPDGMGMGLSICRAIVEAHEGTLWFDRNQPQGTVFRFTLRARPTPVASA